MMRLTTRPAKLNQDHSGKGREVEGEVTKQFKFGILEVGLDQGDLCVITGDAYMSRALFNERLGVQEPMLKPFKPLELAKPIKGALVKVRIPSGSEFEFKDCTIERIRLEPQTGGMTLLSAKVICTPDLDDTLAEFIDALGGPCDIAMDGELPTDQKDLPLSTHGTGEQPETGKPKGRRKGNGRRLTVEVH